MKNTLSAFLHTPIQPPTLLPTQFSHQFYQTTTLHQNLPSNQLSLTNQYTSEMMGYEYSPKKRSRSLHRSSSTSKHSLFQNAKASHKQQRLRSISNKSLIAPQSLNSTQRVHKKQFEFTVPGKNQKSEGVVINEKKTVEDIMNRLKNKKEARLRIVKQIKVEQKQQANTQINKEIQNLWHGQHGQNASQSLKGLNQLEVSAISRNNGTEKTGNKLSGQSMQPNNQELPQQRQKQKGAEKEKEKVKEMEKAVRQMLEEKTKSLQDTKIKVDSQLHLMQKIMSSFQQTVKAKQKQLLEKEAFLKEKQKQIETKISQAVRNVQTQNTNPISPNTHNPYISTSTVKPSVQLNSLPSQDEQGVLSKQFYHSPSNKDRTISHDTEQRFNYNTIESLNGDDKKTLIQQEDSESGMMRTVTATFKRYDASEMIDLDQIQSVNFKTVEQLPKPSKPAPQTVQSVETKRLISSKKSIKTTKQPPISNEHNKPSSIPSNKNIQEVLNTSNDTKLQQNSKDYSQQHKLPKSSSKELQKSFDYKDKAKNKQKQKQMEKEKEKQMEKERQKQKEREKQQQKEKQRERQQRQKQQGQRERQAQRQKQIEQQKQWQQLLKRRQKQKNPAQNNNQRNRKPSMTSSVSSKSKQETEEARQKRKEEKEKIAQVVKAISRVNELVYFIGEIPHHCSNNMKKKKKYSFKLATLYLLKYVYDKFRYLTRLCQDLLKKKAVTKEYLEQREAQNMSIKQSYEKMKSYVYKKEPFPPKKCEKYLDENSGELCMQSKDFIRGVMFVQIKSIIGYYFEETKGKWTEHQVNLCYYRMFLAVFILEEIEFGNIVLDTDDSEYPDYMLKEIENFSEEELRQKMSECYEIFMDLEIN